MSVPHSSDLQTPSEAQVSPAATPRWYTHSYNRPALYRLVATVAPWLPRPVRFALASGVADLARRLMPREQRAVQRNMTQMFPQATPQEITQRTRTLFRHFAIFFADLLSLNRSGPLLQQRYLHRVHGLEHLQAVFATTQGCIAATAHLGNWDLAGRLLSTYGRPVHVLMAPEQAAGVQALVRQRGEQTGLHFVTATGPTVFVHLLTALRRGEIVAVQMDRATGHRSDCLVPFFGAPAPFPLGPFRLAAAAQVPVLPCFCVLRPDRRYDIFVEPVIPVERGHEEAALQDMVRVLERYIAMAPDQWCNFYEVWNPGAAHV